MSNGAVMCQSCVQAYGSGPENPMGNEELLCVNPAIDLNCFDLAKPPTAVTIVNDTDISVRFQEVGKSDF